MRKKRKKRRSKHRASVKKEDAWSKLRGSMKDIFAEFGGGEVYLRAERSNFYSRKPTEKDSEG